MAFTAVTLTGTFQSESGASASGTLTFTLTQPMSNANVIVDPAPIVATLNASGTFSQSLIANDDPATLPAGVQYGVTEQIVGAQPRDYFITVPHANPTVDISVLMPGGRGWQ